MELDLENLVHVLTTQERRKLSDAESQKISEDIRESLFQGLTLSEYVLAKEAKCRLNHKDCLACEQMVKAGNLVLKSKAVPLPVLWNSCFNGIPYDSEKAQRRLLKMPLAALTVDNRVYIVEKEYIQGSMYDSAKREIALIQSPKEQSTYTSRGDFDSLLNYAAQSESEKQILKHTLCSSHNLSKKAARKLYGICRRKKRSEKVNAASEKVKEIKERTKILAKEEKKAYLVSRGFNPDDILTDNSADSDDSDINDHSEVSLESLESDSDGEVYSNELNEPQNKDQDRGNGEHGLQVRTRVKDAIENDCEEIREEFEQAHRSDQRNEQKGTTDRSCWREPSHDASRKNAPVIDVNSIVVLDKLREVSFNWFALVSLLEEQFKTQGYTSAVFDQFLVDFASQLPNLGLTEEEQRLTEHSRIAHLEHLWQKEADMTRITDSASNSSDEEYNNVEALSEAPRDQLRLKLKQIDEKFRKRAKKEIEGQRFLRKKVSQSTKSILITYPDIGDVIERFVQESDVGADSWRRTGVYTFSGDQKKSKRVTFSKIQGKLKEHYGRQFSYGTVVQLCVCRHKRRQSSKRYKGAANVKYQRARKSFSVKYNPDYKWSRSMYKLLDQLQKDGKHIMLLNRDDQAGFRLDSTYTHKSLPTLSVRPTATTRTDFMNKYSAQLQVTSYNFSKTSTSAEVCVGVKASGLHEKSLSQHAADIGKVEKLECTTSVFLNDELFFKEIECVRVDGGADEGPVHHEVQFLWTERHVVKPTKITLVTTRCSGDSYLNRVELQNGCLSKGHSNTFIPSTLCGSPFSENGGIDKEKLKANMSAAVDQYIERVDGTPCMKTKINLSRGVEDHVFLKRRQQLLVFLKGSKKEKQDLRQKNPTLYNYFTEIWQVRENHMDDSLPPNYAFMLKCCGRNGCPHPLCLKGKGSFTPVKRKFFYRIARFSVSYIMFYT